MGTLRENLAVVGVNGLLYAVGGDGDGVTQVVESSVNLNSNEAYTP